MEQTKRSNFAIFVLIFITLMLTGCMILYYTPIMKTAVNKTYFGFEIPDFCDQLPAGLEEPALGQVAPPLWPAWQEAVLLLIFPLTLLLTAPLTSKKQQMRGRKNVVLLGVVLMSVANIFLCILPKLSELWIFMVLNVIFQILNGFGGAMTIPACYSIVIVSFQTEAESLVGLANIGYVFGVILGPFLGLLFNQIKNYIITFVGFTLIFAVVGIVIMIFVPNEVNRTNMNEIKTKYDGRYSFNSLELDQSNDKASSQLSSSKISNVIMSDIVQDFNNKQKLPTYKIFFQQREIVFCLFATTMAIINVSFQQNILVQSFNTRAYLCLSLLKKFLYYLTPSFTFLGGTICVYFLTKVMQRKILIFSGLLLAGFSLFLCGPSYIFGLYDNEKALDPENNYIFAMQISGFGLVAFFDAFVIYCLLSEILCLAHSREDILNDIVLIDRASGLFTIFCAFGFILAIVLGNFMVPYIKQDQQVQNEKFPITCDIIALLGIAFALVFFLTNNVYRDIRRKPMKDPDPIFNRLAQEVLNKMPEDEQPLFGLDYNLKENDLIDQINLNEGDNKEKE